MRLVTRTLFAAAFAAPALTFTAPQFTGPEQLSGQSQIRSVDPGDFDGDGRMDLLAGINLFAFGGELLLFAGDGAGGVEDPVTVGTTSAAAREVRAADMDGDGRLDAVVTSTDGVHRFLQLPGGGFGPEGVDYGGAGVGVWIL